MIQVLIENLLNLKVIVNAGKMGKLFDQPNLKVPNGLFELLEFDQMESANSGRSEEEEDDEDGNDDPELHIRPWIPSKNYKS